MNYVELVNAAAKVCGLPPVSDSDARYILWEYTGFPCFFNGPLHLERQILGFWRHYRDTRRYPPHPLDVIESADQVTEKL